MKNKLFKWGNAIISGLFIAFLFSALYFALISPNFLLRSEYTNGVTFAILGFILLFLLAMGYSDRFCHALRVFFIDWRFPVSTVLFLLAICLQVLFVWQVHPAIGFDVGAIHTGLTNVTDPELRGYFSLNSNNMPILLFQVWLAQLFHTHSWFFFAKVSLVMVDLAALFNLGTVAVINWRRLPVILYIQAGWLALYPMVIVPYTDNWVLPFIALYLLGYFMMAKQTWPLPLRGLGAILTGLGLVAAYLLKPSGVIPFIGLVLVSFLRLFAPQKLGKVNWLKNTCLFVISLAVAGAFLTVGQQKIVHQDYMMINRKRTIPPIHFIQMGMTGDGGYSAHDALMMGKLPTREAKVEYSKKRIRQVLHQRGISYLSFLVEKQGRNTADGTFAWLIEGHFFAKPVDNRVRPRGLASFVYPRGSNLANFRFVAQIAWTSLLFILAFGWQNKRLANQALRLGIIGGMLFLLFFEGGRSRYLIQFLPLFFVLGALSASAAFAKVRALFTWTPIDRQSKARRGQDA